jgi:hypothetical protein
MFNVKYLMLVGVAWATFVGEGLASEPSKHFFRGFTEESFGGKNDFPQLVAMAAKEAEVDETTRHLVKKWLARNGLGDLGNNCRDLKLQAETTYDVYATRNLVKVGTVTITPGPDGTFTVSYDLIAGCSLADAIHVEVFEEPLTFRPNPGQFACQGPPNQVLTCDITDFSRITDCCKDSYLMFIHTVVNCGSYKDENGKVVRNGETAYAGDSAQDRCNGLYAKWCNYIGEVPITNTCESRCDGNTFTPVTCNPASGCVDGTSQQCASKCDGDMFTPVTCNPASGCVDGTTKNCDDSNACTTDTCNPTTGCVNTAITGACVTPGSPTFCKGIGARWKGQYGGAELYLGSSDLGNSNYRRELEYNTFQTAGALTYPISFSWDASTKEIRMTVKNPSTQNTTTLSNVFDGASPNKPYYGQTNPTCPSGSPLGSSCPLGGWNVMEIVVKDSTSTSGVELRNINLGGNLLGTGSFGTIDVSGTPGFSSWTVTGFDFNLSFTVMADMNVNGFTGNENIRVEFLVGCSV